MTVENSKPRGSFTQIGLPFLSTYPLTDLGFLFLLLPVWWVLGVEQFVWPVALAGIMTKVLIKRRFKLRMMGTAWWIVFFVCFHLISGLFIVEAFRWLTFTRNLSTYLAALLSVLIVVNEVESWYEVRLLLTTLGLVMLFAAVVGTLGISGLWQPNFVSGMGQILPGWIKNTTYGGRIAFKTIGRSDWFSGLGVYFRVNSTFAFATSYASALAVTLPIVLFLFAQARGSFTRFLWGGSALLMSLNLIYTTARIAIISLLLGAVWYLWFSSRFRRVVRWIAIPITVSVIVVLLGSVLLPQGMDFLTDFYKAFLYARGEGSFLDRSLVYRKTLEGIRERPIFGWGTERDVSDLPYPAGSHSYYLGVLYKHGVFGLFAFLGILVVLWNDTRPFVTSRSQLLVQNQPSVWLERLLEFGRWVMVVVLGNSFTEVLDLDATTMVMMWTIFGVLVASRGLLLEKSEHAHE